MLHSPLNQCCVNFCLPPTDKSTQQISIIWLGWLNAWAFVCELSGSGFESRCFQLRLLIQKFLKYIKKNNNFWWHRWHHVCLVSNCGPFEAGILSAPKNFIMFSGKPFEWVHCFLARIFISPTSDTPTFKSFSLKLFFRETMNGQSIAKKTLTSTFPNNLRSMHLPVFSGGCRFVLRASSDLPNRVKKTQWLTSDYWGCLLHGGQKLAVDSQKAHKKNKVSSWLADFDR